MRNIPLTDADGKSIHLYDLKDKKAIVLVFLSFECPVSTSYSQPLADIAADLAKHDVAFFGLTTNQEETPAEVVKHAKEFKLPFPVLLDKSSSRLMRGRGVHAGGVRARRQFYPALPGQDRRLLLRPPQEEPASHRSTI